MSVAEDLKEQHHDKNDKATTEVVHDEADAFSAAILLTQDFTVLLEVGDTHLGA